MGREWGGREDEGGQEAVRTEGREGRRQGRIQDEGCEGEWEGGREEEKEE